MTQSHRHNLKWIHRARRHRAAGLTLVELILSMAGAGLIALAVAAMLFATAAGTDSRRDMRGMVVRQKTLTTRLAAAVRSSHMILDHGDNWLLLWINDDNASDAPNLSEVCYIEHDAVTGDLSAYTHRNPGTDTSYDLAGPFNSLITALAARPAQRWATHVSDFQFTLDDGTVSARDAGLVSYRATFTVDRLTTQAIGAAALRNRGS